jgi:hypothetical protein
MHTARGEHAAVYHAQCVYVLGGYNLRYLSYSCTEGRWEVLAALPLGGAAMSLDSPTWQLMQLKLP